MDKVIMVLFVVINLRMYALVLVVIGVINRIVVIMMKPQLISMNRESMLVDVLNSILILLE